MAEVGCLKDGSFQNLHVENGISGYLQNYLDFHSGWTGNLDATGITIDETASAAGPVDDATAAEILACTLKKNAVNSHTGTAAAVGVLGYLPPALKGDHLALEIVGELDDATSALHVEARGAVGSDSNVFAKQIIGYNTGGIAGSAIETRGTRTVPTTQTLIYTPAAAATNFLGPGSVLHFFCPKDDQWLVEVRAAPKGTGATGAFTDTV
jgi:hypothetical protein